MATVMTRAGTGALFALLLIAILGCPDDSTGPHQACAPGGFDDTESFQLTPTGGSERSVHVCATAGYSVIATFSTCETREHDISGPGQSYYRYDADENEPDYPIVCPTVAFFEAEFTDDPSGDHAHLFGTYFGTGVSPAATGTYTSGAESGTFRFCWGGCALMH